MPRVEPVLRHDQIYQSDLLIFSLTVQSPPCYSSWTTVSSLRQRSCGWRARLCTRWQRRGLLTIIWWKQGRGYCRFRRFFDLQELQAPSDTKTNCQLNKTHWTSVWTVRTAVRWYTLSWVCWNFVHLNVNGVSRVPISLLKLASQSIIGWELNVA